MLDSGQAGCHDLRHPPAGPAGTIERFAAVGNFASYARCVDSARLSNGKKKGQGNVKNGNAYLAWGVRGSG